MERLTWTSVIDGYEDIGLKDGVSEGDAICRLAAYEDAGMEPEEVAEYKHLCDSYAEAGLDAKFIQFCIDAMQNGLSVNRICELAQAEKDGRLVVLPFKPGTEYFGHCRIRNANPISTGRFYPPYVPTLGVDAWLTREKAEAALKKREEADNEATDN